MSQADVLKYLKKNRQEWLSARELAQGMDRLSSSITKNLRALRETNFLKYRLRDNPHKELEYKYK